MVYVSPEAVGPQGGSAPVPRDPVDDAARRAVETMHTHSVTIERSVDSILRDEQGRMIGVMGADLSDVQAVSTNPSHLGDVAENVREQSYQMISDTDWVRFLSSDEFRNGAAELFEELGLGRDRLARYIIAKRDDLPLGASDAQKRLAQEDMRHAIESWDMKVLRTILETGVRPRLTSEADRRKQVLDILEANRGARERQTSAGLREMRQILDTSAPQLLADFDRLFANPQGAVDTELFEELEAIENEVKRRQSEAKRSSRQTGIAPMVSKAIRPLLDRFRQNSIATPELVGDKQNKNAA